MFERKQRLIGVVDMHIHSKPDVRERRSSDLELALEARRLGLRAIVLKSHVVPTAGRAWLTERAVGGVDVFGGIALNREVGGLNPHAVSTAIAMGGKIVWLPTIWAYNDRKRGKGLDDGIRVLGDDGRPVPELLEILRMVADADIQLATGHLSFDETYVVARCARELGVRKIVVNHPEWPTVDISLEEQKKLLEFGVYFERTFERRPIGETRYVSNLEINLEAIREIGWESTVISTDGGQTDAPFWGEAIAEYVDFLYDSGLPDDAVDVMTRKNPARLLGLDSM